MFSTALADDGTYATNVTSITEAKSASAGSGVQGPTANGPVGETSRPGEQNELHVALAIVGLGVVAIITGYLNVKVGK